jgi:hypothetical protein
MGTNHRTRLVSLKPGHLALLKQWFEQKILPLYERHLELSQASLYMHPWHDVDSGNGVPVLNCLHVA